MPFNSIVKRVPVYSGVFCPSRQALTLSAKLVYPICSGVSHLLASCRPTAISGFIISVVVNAFDFFSFRSLAHIRKEVFKRIEPSVAYSNSSTAVMVVFCILIPVTAILHGAPRTVSSSWVSPFSAMAVTVLSHHLAEDLGMKAPARLFITASEYNATGYTFSSAVASTLPPRARFSGIDFLNNEQATKSLPGKINGFRHGDIINDTMSHVNT